MWGRSEQGDTPPGLTPPAPGPAHGPAFCFAEPAGPQHGGDGVLHTLGHQVQGGFGPEVHVRGWRPGHVRILQVTGGVSSCPPCRGFAKAPRGTCVVQAPVPVPGLFPPPNQGHSALEQDPRVPTSPWPGLGHPVGSVGAPGAAASRHSDGNTWHGAWGGTNSKPRPAPALTLTPDFPVKHLQPEAFYGLYKQNLVLVEIGRFSALWDKFHKHENEAFAAFWPEQNTNTNPFP